MKARTTRRCAARSAAGTGGAADPTAGATRQLPRGGRRALDDRGDVVERHTKHIVENEGDPLGGRQRVEDEE